MIMSTSNAPTAAAATAAGAPARKSAKVEKTPTHNPDPAYCSYYVSRKHRFCRTECKPGSLYCCTHDIGEATSAHAASAHKQADNNNGSNNNSSADSGDVRVPCPINPNHTVYASRLEKHVKVCPDLRFVTSQLPYYSENKHANRGAVFEPLATGEKEKDKSTARRTHRDLSPDALAALIAKVSECYRTCVEPEMVIMSACDPEIANTGITRTASGVSAAGSVPSPSSVSESPLASLAHSESTSQKHGPQHTALLRCLSDVVLQSRSADSILTQYSHLHVPSAPPLPATACAMHVDGFLEFGAGKGGLSVALQQLVVQHLDRPTATPEEVEKEVSGAENERATLELSGVASVAAPWPFLKAVAPQPPLVVLDMDGFRRKGDARVRHSAVPLRRLRINIKDVDLTKAFLTDIHPGTTSSGALNSIATLDGATEERATSLRTSATPEKLENWAALGKHLCGACTDFALSCLTEAPSLAQSAHVRLPIVVIATCCHHRCELKHLNPPSLVAAQGESSVQAAPPVLTMPGSTFTWSPDEFAALTSMTSWAVCGGFVGEEKRQVGWQCKRVIDQLRVHFLRQLGYVAFQCQYTTRDVTEENICLVAFQTP